MGNRAKGVSGFLRCLIIAMTVASGGAALAQIAAPGEHPAEPEFQTEFLTRGFGVLNDRVVEGVILKRYGESPVARVQTLSACVDLCQQDLACRSFTYMPDKGICDLKSNNTFFPSKIEKFVSGISLPTRELERRDGEVVKFPHESFVIEKIISQHEDCAEYCRISSQYNDTSKICSSFSFRPFRGSLRATECIMSRSTETVPDNRYSTYITQTAKGSLHNFIIADMRSVEGEVIKKHSGIYSLDKCAEQCKNDSACKSFVFRPSQETCEFKGSDKFSRETGVFDHVSGLKNQFGMRFQAVYLVPAGKTPRPNAKSTILAMLKLIQEHYGLETGKTFGIDEEVIEISNLSENINDLAASPKNNKISGIDYDTHRYSIGRFGGDYVHKKNIMIYIIEGLSDTSYGTAGSIIISDKHWDPIYRNYNDGLELRMTKEIIVISHEIGHALGLQHNSDTIRCLKSNGIKDNDPMLQFPPPKSSIMFDEPDTLPLFDNHFSEWEKMRLLGENISDTVTCSYRFPFTPKNNIRPPSESYLRFNWP